MNAFFISQIENDENSSSNMGGLFSGVELDNISNEHSKHNFSFLFLLNIFIFKNSNFKIKKRENPSPFSRE